MYTLILAASPTEAMRYAAEQGMPNRTARPVVSAAAINGLRVSTVIELPSYARRPDRFAIEAVLRKAERRDHFERIVLDHWEPREPLAREKTSPADLTLRGTIKINDDVWNDHQDEPVLVPLPVPVSPNEDKPEVSTFEDRYQESLRRPADTAAFWEGIG